MIAFEHPWLLLLLLIPLALIGHYLYLQMFKRKPHFRVSIMTPWLIGQNSFWKFFSHIPFVLRTLALVMLVLAIARPRSASESTKIDSEGIDIALVMDISSSMLAMDFEPNRIMAAKEIATKFISQRPSDRMCIVVFSGEAYTQCPLTTDRASLINMMNEINIQDDVIDPGTAIGNGLATAVNRLKNSNSKSKVIILLTDGVNNTGAIDPLMAAELAKTFNVKVYTIGVGTKGQTPMPVQTLWGTQVQYVQNEIDEALLKEIATKTGAQYFRATDNSKLLEIYNQINKLEKVKTTVESYPVYKELFGYFGIIALIALLLEFLLKYLILRTLP